MCTFPDSQPTRVPEIQGPFRPLVQLVGSRRKNEFEIRFKSRELVTAIVAYHQN
jgi:hypothetical protein